MNKLGIYYKGRVKCCKVYTKEGEGRKEEKKGKRKKKEEREQV